MNEIKFIWSKGLEAFEPCKAVREAVFIKEQGFKNEFDETDKTALHLSITSAGKPIATARIFLEEEGVFHAGRICILKDFRGLHLGARLISELKEKAKALGGKKIVISAQKDKEGFYQKQGFKTVSDDYYDEHCLHVDMEMDI